MARPVIALLTDFGTRDPYVAAMKGVIVDLCAEVTIVDLSHDVPAHDVRAGARFLAACVPYYPAGTIFVAVIDPGVGSARRAIAAEAGSHRFVGPDNGVFSAVFDHTTPKRIVELTDRRFQRPTLSRTFEGRDRFAPAAAHLARGVGLASLGRAVHGYEHLTWPAPTIGADAVEGEVETVDRFGNLISTLPRAVVETLMASGPADVHLGTQTVARLVATYADVGAGEPCALFGSTDRLEIAIHGGSAAAHFAAGAGTPVAVRRRRDV